MAITYESIATTTLGSAQSSVTFSSISGSFTDLVLVCWAKVSANDKGLRLQFNGDTGSNYSWTQIYGDGTSAGSSRASNDTSVRFVNGLMTDGGIGIAHIQNYSNTTTNKTVLGRGGMATNLVSSIVSLWRNTSAITSMVIKDDAGGNFASGSTFSLYGIKSA